ncbi:hypothetical protein AB0M36_09535 [Actinoplanes sp. NPDC051346]|uniref:hypothetical protein n=1 Tax=Actinoplanes sp. NPDC051346 TaxID=3155048 RepID=UPI0034460FAD
MTQPWRQNGVLIVDGIALRDGLYLHLSDRDYKFGTGDINVVVRGDEGVSPDEDGDWWVVLNVDQVVWDRPKRSRPLAVRASAIRPGIRSPRQPESP